MKSIAVLLILLTIGLHSHAQNEESRLKFGAKAGFNLSFFNHDVGPFDQPDPDYSYFKRSARGAIAAGLTLDIEMAKGFSFGTELLFNSRGMSYREKNDGVIIEDEEGRQKNAYNYYNYNIDYLELPIIINYNFKPEKSKTMVIGYVGIAQAITLNHTIKLDYPKTDSGPKDQKAGLQDVHSLNKSIVAGVKLGEKEVTGIDMFIDFRGSYTLSKVFNKPVNDYGENLNTHMYTFTLAFGIKF